MAMGTRETDQPPLWIATSDLPTSPGHPFYARLTTLLDGHHFDRFVEGLCDRFYAPVMGRPGLAPGRYFRLLLVGYFEGIDSERGIAWRAQVVRREPNGRHSPVISGPKKPGMSIGPIPYCPRTRSTPSDGLILRWTLTGSRRS